MAFYSLPTGKLRKKQRLKSLKKYLLATKPNVIGRWEIHLINILIFIFNKA